MSEKLKLSVKEDGYYWAHWGDEDWEVVKITWADTDEPSVWGCWHTDEEVCIKGLILGPRLESPDDISSGTHEG